MSEQEKTSTEQENKVVRNEKGQIISGTANPHGRPKGKKNFETEWRIFISKVAEDNGMTPQEINEQLYRKAWSKAKEGDYQFYRDIQDRLFGKPSQNIDHTSDGEKIDGFNVTITNANED